MAPYVGQEMCLVTMTTSELVENNSPSSAELKHYSSDSDWTVAQVGGASHSAANVSTQLTGEWSDCFQLHVSRGHVTPAALLCLRDL